MIESIVDADATVATILVGREYARAVVHVRPPGAEVWIVENQVPVLRESIAPTGKKGTSEQIALRAVEVVRASLLHLPEKPPPPKPEPPKPPPPVVVPAPPPKLLGPRSFEVALGAGLAASPASGALAAQLGAHAIGVFDVDVLCAYVPTRRAVRAPEGEARLGLAVAGARARVRVDVATTSFYFGLGGGLAVGLARATATAPYEASSVTLWSPALLGSATVKAKLLGPIDLWLDLSAVLTRPIVLRVLERDVARVAVTGLFVGGLGVSFR